MSAVDFPFFLLPVLLEVVALSHDIQTQRLQATLQLQPSICMSHVAHAKHAYNMSQAFHGNSLELYSRVVLSLSRERVD
jgi:hypothetical protein